MQLFLTDDDFAQLEARLASTGTSMPRQTNHVPSTDQVALAWHLRERDSRRAVSLAQQALAELALGSADDPQTARHRLRLQLLLAECHWLFAELDLAESQTRAIIQEAKRLPDILVLADAHLLLAHIAGDRGDLAGRYAELDATAAMAVGSGDDFRMEFAQLCIAHAALRQNTPAASAQWGAQVRELLAKPAHPALHVMCNEFLTFEALQKSDFAAVFRICSHTVGPLKRAGMVRQIALSMTLLGVAYANLNDDTQALEWMQRSLALARSTGWPLVLGNALLQVSSVQRSLKQFEAAQAALNEALPLLEPLKHSRTFALGLVYLAELQRDMQQPAAALEAARQFDAPAAEARPLDLRLHALAVAALSLSELGRPDEALATANTALQLARGADLPLHLSDALGTLARLHSQHRLPAPPDMQAASASLHFLLQSLAAFPPELQTEGVPPSVFDAIAAEYAKLGDHAQAYAYAQRARAASEAVHGQDVSKRQILLETKFHTERSELLSQTSATLGRLSVIGQEITGHLDEAAVYATLNRNVHGLLAASHFSVYLLDAAGENLVLAYGAEDGQRMASFSIPMAHPSANSVRCAIQRHEIFLEIDPKGQNNPIPGTQQTLSAMFMPLIAGEQLLGVMSIQSTQAQAYADRERLIFRSLAAYGAIAIDNAQNYRRLEATLVSLHQAQAEVLDKNQELERAYQSLKDISLTDPLTGLRNRRFLEQNLAGEISQCLRHYEDWRRHPVQPAPQDADLIFLLVDIDHFKHVNDDWGHPAGDAVLVQMRARLRQACRDSDYLVRWGGEEFLVVARATNASAAADFAERIRVAVTQQPFEIEAAAPLALTCSVGFASLPFIAAQPERLDWQQVVGLADQALYMAKRSGRNAWVGLSATAKTPALGDVSELLLSPQASANAGWLRIETMRPLA
ncbi:diguanylate cyclase [Paucibacter sp. B2R-40]|uniref:diguanylate cyclase domain-containing protein n=1 Tax=Paucibacter sp. B2R-40 TaxID=2893554 RepID=UPI0021E3DFBF|nr:diguanylate cyclase [Paucibacter sp. B2R-40]MCV2352856.1 diguanylate cyclase [Paucibacter sp. B2R-40]